MLYQNITREQLVMIVSAAVQKALAGRQRTVPVGISVRHIHLSRADMDRLFGRNTDLTPRKKLSQPGQFAAEECVDVIGPKGTLHKVRVLGPLRGHTQVELAQTDCRTIGVDAPVRASGDLQGTPGLALRGPLGEIAIPSGVIVADRHIHLSAAQGRAYGLADGDRVRVSIGGIKPGTMDNVLVRCGDQHEMDFHIDTDDGNAFQLRQGQLVTILGKEETV